MASNTTAAAGGLNHPATTAPTHHTSTDPFAAHRTADNDPFAAPKLSKLPGSGALGGLHHDDNSAALEDEHDYHHHDDGVGAGVGVGSGGSPTRDRRNSKEWDASKVPPSRFQKRSGSIYSTPSSRDAHLDGHDRDKGYWEKMKEKGWIKK